MKKLLAISLVSVIITTVIMISYTLSFSQFKTSDCVAKLNGYTFLKTYKLDNPQKEAEYSYVFSKDNNYMVIICNKDGLPRNASVTLYDSNRNLIASSYDEVNKRHYYALAYNCKSTGIYYMKFQFDEPSPDCSSVLAFKR
ncbi:MAG: hypothetical protein NZ529_05290 [Cytophagaceae bacterium]|nr:hypothetical protein [Cytophagaceae bacterium]MDW8456191.1 hypothetical protein [Cytophagaceae bacterium]